MVIYNEVEVALIISILPDAWGAGEGSRKEETPKDGAALTYPCWAYGEESYDCHPADGALLEEKDIVTGF